MVEERAEQTPLQPLTLKHDLLPPGAKLKNNREVCINPETKWLQQYLKNAINKVKKSRRRNGKKN
ncbi:hypothetical protein F7725_016188 [Dissostichus mawsoni]|uniref:Chemokine interleukin-8-like domain-containing protein n=1 Tax=Dissostichus mawsoni TaxID=36200 RepID=A0A7J5Y450_DISMA|nr:hypothetical protein F7725_016188 [Dissostichus mawsoni]